MRMKPLGWVILWCLTCILIWAPVHMMWLLPFMNQMILNGEMTMGAANVIGLYSSLFPLALVGAINCYFFMKGEDK